MPPILQSRLNNDLWWILMLGVLLMIMGLFLITAPGMTSLVLIQFLGIYWLAMGIVSIIQIFMRSSLVHWGWLLFTGILGILAGFLVLRHPVLSTFATVGFLTYLIVFVGVLRGVIGILQGMLGEGLWNTVLGIVLVLISVYLLFNPFKTFLALPVVIGIFALLGGAALVYLGVEARNRLRARFGV